jgi:hypothetical protein
MNAVKVLTLLLALSGALNAAFAVGITARHAGAGASPGHPHRRRCGRHPSGYLLHGRLRLPLITTWPWPPVTGDSVKLPGSSG